MVWFFDRQFEAIAVEARRGADRRRFEVVVRKSDGTSVAHVAENPAALLGQLRDIPHGLMAAGWRPRYNDALSRFVVVD